MVRIDKHRGNIFTLLLVASFVVWSALPSFNHAPRVFDTVQEHLEMIEDHGHSHGFAEDLLWAMHGHDHDDMDHDHSPVVLSSSKHDFYLPNNKDWRQSPPKYISSSNFLIERPPRV